MTDLLPLTVPLLSNRSGFETLVHCYGTRLAIKERCGRIRETERDALTAERLPSWVRMQRRLILKMPVST